MSNSRADRLFRNIQNRTATVGVIGLGYVGLPLAIEFAKNGFPVLGFDLDSAKVDAIRKGQGYIKHITDEMVREITDREECDATTDFSRLSEADCLLICVPTPLTENREPEMAYIINTAEQIAGRLRKGQMVILESTTYPGTTQEILRPRLEQSGRKAGIDFFLAYSPEREDPGNPTYSTSRIPKVVGGLTAHCRKLACALYDAIVVKTIPVSSPDAAEATKLLENIFRSVNIALVNELKTIFSAMGIDVWEVITAASTKPFGYMPFYPGPGLGGHCIPIDPFYLTWRARQFEVPTRFIELAGEINTAMPSYVVDHVMHALNDDGKPLKGSRILLLGAAYKKDVDDMRESPTLKLIELLREKGAKVSYHDPFVPELHPMRKYDYRLKSTRLTPKTLASVDAVVIATAHTDIDYARIGEHAPLVIDTRNAMSGLRGVKARVVKA